jgi:hypothetical protein
MLGLVKCAEALEDQVLLTNWVNQLMEQYPLDINTGFGMVSLIRALKKEGRLGEADEIGAIILTRFKGEKELAQATREAISK